jgi:branched-chain amino acid transport system permease protein
VKIIGEAAKLVTGHAPGLDLVVYGTVLVLVVAFAPRGVAGAATYLRNLLSFHSPSKGAKGSEHG